jgi:hypothetical protein
MLLSVSIIWAYLKLQILTYYVSFILQTVAHYKPYYIQPNPCWLTIFYVECTFDRSIHGNLMNSLSAFLPNGRKIRRYWMVPLDLRPLSHHDLLPKGCAPMPPSTANKFGLVSSRAEIFSFGLTLVTAAGCRNPTCDNERGSRAYIKTRDESFQSSRLCCERSDSLRARLRNPLVIYFRPVA